MTHTLSGRPPNMRHKRHKRHTRHGTWPQASHPSPSVTKNAIKSMVVTLVTLVTNKPDPNGKGATSVTPSVTQASATVTENMTSITATEAKAVRESARGRRQGATPTPRPMRAGGGPISRAFSTRPAYGAKLLRGHNETKKVEDR
jgi:hypothetical protein